MLIIRKLCKIITKRRNGKDITIFFHITTVVRSDYAGLCDFIYKHIAEQKDRLAHVKPYEK